MSVAVIDASVIGMWMLPDETVSDGAASLQEDFVAGKITLVAPRVLEDEMTSTIWKAVRDGRVAPPESRGMLERSRHMGISYVSGESTDAKILMLSTGLRHSPFDCSYLALALALGCDLYTADRRFIQKAQSEYPCVKNVDDYSRESLI